MTREEIAQRVERDRLSGRAAYLEYRSGAPDPEKIEAAKARADAVLGLWNKTASEPVPGETEADYRRRLLRTIQENSPKFRDKDFSRASLDALDFAEQLVYADAREAAYDPATVPPGQLRAVRERDEAGRLVTRWVGTDPIWMSAFMQPGARGILSRKIAGLE